MSNQYTNEDNEYLMNSVNFLSNFENNNFDSIYWPFNLFNEGESDSIVEKNSTNRFEIPPLDALDINKNKKNDEASKNDIKVNNGEKTFYFTTIKLGRKRKNENSFTYHSKYSPDNVLRKIQVHFINYIVKFLNKVLKILGYEDEFFKIDNGFKINVNKKNIEKLKELKIKDILSQKISKKYSKQKNKGKNKAICKNIENDPIIRNIFSYNYIQFFKDFYLNEESNIDLAIFGSDIKFDLYEKEDKIYKYKDLKQKFNSDPEYIDKLEKCKNNLIKDEINIIKNNGNV